MFKGYLHFDRSLFSLTTSVGKISFIALFIPVLFENASTMILGTVNTAVISGFSENAAAAIGTCAPVITMFLLLQNVISMGAGVLISNRIGARELDAARQTAYSGAAVGIFCSAMFMPLAISLAPFIMLLQNLEGEILDIAIGYFRIRAMFFIPQGLVAYILAVLRCYGHTKYTFYAGVLNNLLNLMLSILAVSIPNTTPTDAANIMALGCGAATCITLLYVIFIYKRKGISFSRPDTLGSFWAYVGRILHIGVPSAISSMSFTLSQVVTTSFVAIIGGYALTAKVIFTQILSYAYLFSYSAGSANAILVGMRYGAKQYSEMCKMSKLLTKATSLINLAVSLSIIALRVPLVSAFSANESILALSLSVFAADILTEQGRAVSHVYEYALRAIGDVWATLGAILISCWLLGIGLAYICAIELGMGIVGCWIGLAADECFRGIFTYFRWKAVTKKLINN
jgi:putative MATE family efflux protein